MTELANKIKRSARSAVCTPLNRLLNYLDPPVLVLLFHRVISLSSDPEMLAVSPDNFRTQLRYLKENYPIVRFEEDWSVISKPAVSITFDDGYADNLLEALPILEELELPATFFIATGTIGTAREFWWHELERIILEGHGLPESFTLEDASRGRRWPTATGAQRRVCYQELVQLMTDADTACRDNWLAQIRRWRNSDAVANNIHRSLTREELRLLAENRWITIGAHTVTHTRLSSLSPDAQREEITTCKSQLEAWTGAVIPVFSYPYGRRCDYTRESIALSREAGFVKAAANFPGQAHRWTDPHQIPRHLVRNWPVETFAEKLRGFWTR